MYTLVNPSFTRNAGFKGVKIISAWVNTVISESVRMGVAGICSTLHVTVQHYGNICGILLYLVLCIQSINQSINQSIRFLR